VLPGDRAALDWLGLLDAVYALVEPQGHGSIGESVPPGQPRAWQALLDRCAPLLGARAVSLVDSCHPVWPAASARCIVLAAPRADWPSLVAHSAAAGGFSAAEAQRVHAC
jgi:hypothetical protein